MSDYKSYFLNSPADEAAFIAMLEAAGYERRNPWSGSGPGCYEIEIDIEPREGRQTLTLTVFEDPTKPVLARLDEVARQRAHR